MMETGRNGEPNSPKTVSVNVVTSVVHGSDFSQGTSGVVIGAIS